MFYNNHGRIVCFGYVFFLTRHVFKTHSNQGGGLLEDKRTPPQPSASPRINCKRTEIMITKHDDLLGTLVHDVAHLLRHEIDRRLKPHNLTRVKWLALGIIAKNPDLTQAELAADLELGNAAVGRLVDRLEQRRFIIRKPDPDDRRAYRLTLTKTAGDLLNHLKDTASELRFDVLSGFSASEVRTLNNGLNKLEKNLKSIASLSLTVLFASVQKIEMMAELPLVSLI